MKCLTCGHNLEERSTERCHEYWTCANIQCPDYGPQSPIDPIDVVIDYSTIIGIVIALFLTGALLWIGLDAVEGLFR